MVAMCYCIIEQKHCPLCHIRKCEFNFPLIKEDRSCVKGFLGSVAKQLGWNFLELRYKI